MILSWNMAEMPANGVDVADATKLSVNFRDRRTGAYLGAVSWINLETGAYEVRLRDAEGSPVMIDGHYLYQPCRISPEHLAAYLRAPDGSDVVEVSFDYLRSAMALLRGGHGAVA